MRKSTSPWDRLDLPEIPLEQERKINFWVTLFSLALMSCLIAAFTYVFVQALDHEAEMAQRIGQERKAERERIYNANVDILKGHEHYRLELDKRVELAYRQGN
jgi:hypothetical protein